MLDPNGLRLQTMLAQDVRLLHDCYVIDKSGLNILFKSFKVDSQASVQHLHSLFRKKGIADLMVKAGVYRVAAVRPLLSGIGIPISDTAWDCTMAQYRDPIAASSDALPLADTSTVGAGHHLVPCEPAESNALVATLHPLLQDSLAQCPPEIVVLLETMQEDNAHLKRQLEEKSMEARKFQKSSYYYCERVDQKIDTIVELQRDLKNTKLRTSRSMEHKKGIELAIRRAYSNAGAAATALILNEDMSRQLVSTWEHRAFAALAASRIDWYKCRHDELHECASQKRFGWRVHAVRGDATNAMEQSKLHTLLVDSAYFTDVFDETAYASNPTWIDTAVENLVCFCDLQEVASGTGAATHGMYTKQLSLIGLHEHWAGHLTGHRSPDVWTAWLTTSDKGPDQVKMKAIKRSIIEHEGKKTLDFNIDCLKHQTNLGVKDGLVLMDYVSKVMFLCPSGFFGSLAKWMNWWRSTGQKTKIFKHATDTTDVTIATKYYNKFPPQCLSGRWGAVINVLNFLLDIPYGEAGKPHVVTLCLQMLAPKTEAITSDIPRALPDEDAPALGPIEAAAPPDAAPIAPPVAKAAAGRGRGRGLGRGKAKAKGAAKANIIILYYYSIIAF